VVVHVYTGRSFAVQDLVSRLVGRPRSIGVLAGGGLPDFARRHPHWVSRVLGRFDLLVAPSAFLARWARQTVDVPVVVVPNPFDPDTYGFRLRGPLRPRLLWLRAYHPIYAPEVAVRAAAELRDVDGLRLTMVGGDKGELAATRQRVDQLGLDDLVDVRGFAGESEKRRLFEEHDLFLNTSRVDNRPVTVVEAGAAGLCVVSTDVGGVPDLVVDGESALLVAPDEPRAVADAVRRLLGDPALARRLSAGARRVAEEGSPAAVVARWNDLLSPSGA